MKQITTFWNYFQKNEQEIFNAILLGINTEEVFFLFDKKLKYVSKKIGYIISCPEKPQDKFTLIFTGFGYRKLFAKIIALEEQAPTLKHFTPQAFIKPLKEVSKYRNGIDKPFIFGNYEIKISELQLALLDYNVATKKIKLDLFVPNFHNIKHFDDLTSNINWVLMQTIGEIAFHKHIKEIHLHQMPLEPQGLLSLMELPDFIDYLYKINSTKKTRQI
ncbi:MAG: hypothetical protein H7Y10_14770 [Flavobacterium sp.]|nr:hypothetical protein [Flavobacterium sp.]